MCQYTEYTGCNSIQYSPAVYWVYQCAESNSNYRVYQYTVSTSIQGVPIHSIHQHAGWINTYNPPVCRCQGISINYVHQYKGEPIQYFQYTGYINKLRPPVYRVNQYSIFSIQGISINYVYQYTGWTNTVFWQKNIVNLSIVNPGHWTCYSWN